MSKRVFKTELDAVNNSLQAQVNNSISKTIVDAKGDIVTASAADTPIRLAVGTNEQRLVADSATTSGLKYVADTTNYAVGAKGDLLVGTAADTVSALTVGANGDTLVADSSTTTGLRWNPVKSLVNPLINSAFDIFQRTSTPTTGISIGGGFGYTLDRWISRTATGSGVIVTSRQVTNDTTNLPFIQFCARLRRNTGNSDTGALQIQQAIETTNSIPFIGRQVTLSFYARKGSGFTGTFSGSIYSGTVGDEALVVGFTGLSLVAQAAPTLTTDWVRYTATGTVSSSAKQIGVVFSHGPTGTAGSDDFYEVTGVQIDLGAVALPFARTGGTLAGELAACQRYFERVSPGGAYGSLASPGFFTATTNFQPTTIYKVTKRGVPTFSSSAANTFLAGAAGVNFTPSAIALSDAGLNSATLAVTVSGATTGQGATLVANNNTGAYIEFSAEL